MKSYSLAVHYEAFAFLIGTFQPVNGEPAAVTEDLHHTKAVCFRSSGLKINQGTAVGNVLLTKSQTTKSENLSVLGHRHGLPLNVFT